MLKTNAVFERKQNRFQTQNCLIEAIEELSAAEFKVFCENMLTDRSFIADHMDDMYVDENKVHHGLLVLGEDTEDAVLVDSSGYSYGRYTAFLPNFKPYINRQILLLADEIIKDGIQNTSNGSWAIYFDEIQDMYGVHVTPNNGIGTLLLRDLTNSDEIAEIEPMEDGFDITFYLDFCSSLEDKEKPEPAVSKLKDMLSCLWEDVHLLHKDVEIEPCTIVELQDVTLTDAGKDAWADVLNADVIRIYAGVYGLQMELGNVNPCRLESFSAMLAGNCSVENYEKWVAAEGECCQALEM